MDTQVPVVVDGELDLHRRAWNCNYHSCMCCTLSDALKDPGEGQGIVAYPGRPDSDYDRSVRTLESPVCCT